MLQNNGGGGSYEYLLTFFQILCAQEKCFIPCLTYKHSHKSNSKISKVRFFSVCNFITSMGSLPAKYGLTDWLDSIIIIITVVIK